MKHWAKILSDRDVKAVLFNGQVADHVARYVDEEFGKLEVTYLFGREYWGRGISTEALSMFLKREETARPIYATGIERRLRSMRVLEKCGFKAIGKRNELC